MTLNERRIKIMLERDRLIRRLARKKKNDPTAGRDRQKLYALTMTALELENRIGRQERKAA